MRNFQVTTRVNTPQDIGSLTASLQTHLRRVAISVEKGEAANQLVARGTQYKLQHDSYKDKTTFTVEQSGAAYLVTAETKFGPALCLWIWLVVGLLFIPLWLIPLIGGFRQAKKVRREVESIFAILQSEAEDAKAGQTPTPNGQKNSHSESLEELERLGNLFKQGLVSEEEFRAFKQQLLGDPASAEGRNGETDPLSTPDAGYFIKRGTQVAGPYSTDKLRKLRAKNKLHDSDEVGSSKEGPWRRLSDAQQINC